MSGGRPLVVLQLVANPWWTGSADPVIQLARGLEAHGHLVLLGMIPGGPFEDKARAAGLRVVDGLSLSTRPSPGGLLADLRRLRSLVRTQRVDVVHTHHSHDHWLGRLTRGSAALVRTFHNARSVARGPLARTLYRGTDAVLAVSREIAVRCAEAGIPASRVVRVEGVVDVSRYLDGAGGQAWRKELGLGRAPVVGCVARLAAGRGHELLIAGFRGLLARRPDARLVLVGKGERREALRALVRDSGLGHAVILAGYRGPDLPQALAAMDVFALMGAGSDESCRSAIEAMAAARPVVALGVGALADTVVDQVTGLLLTAPTPEAVMAALLALVDDPVRAQRMGEAGQQRALQRFTPERHARAVEAVYRSALARRHP